MRGGDTPCSPRMFSNVFPSFGIAPADFSVYVMAEIIIRKEKHRAVEDKCHWIHLPPVRRTLDFQLRVCADLCLIMF